MAGRPPINKLYYFPKPNRWQNGIGTEMPEAYRKFWREWKIQRPIAVHYIKEEGKYKIHPYTQRVVPVQNIPLPLIFPNELHQGIWGGEAVVLGKVKKGKFKLPVPKYWFPKLFKSVVYSEVLNKYMRTVITLRTIDLIHANYGFDHYLLKTPACDLQSLLALKIKRNILIALADKTLYPDDEKKREEVYEKYKEYLTAYTREDIDWYGLTWLEAIKKQFKINRKAIVIEPFKIKYRAELIKNLKEGKSIDSDEESEDETPPPKKSSWLSRINPFS